MSRSTLVVLGSTMLLLVGAWVVSAQTDDKSAKKKRDPESIRYQAEEGIPKDKDAEKRRDYAVWEAALNDLTSATNPEYKYRIRNAGPGKEIVVNAKTSVETESPYPRFHLDHPSRNIDGTDTQNIPVDVQEDFKSRSRRAADSLADFKPANPAIIVHDLDSMCTEPFPPFKDGLEAIYKKYPTAWGYVWAYHPAYSKDGNSALVVFDAPGGRHGGDWMYMLRKTGKRWAVVWRHVHHYR
jgi:hypothetical protein